MNNQGFSTAFIMIMSILALIIGAPIVWATAHNMSVNNQKKQIASKIADLHITVTPQKEQCGGDGVDSNPWCDYEYATSPGAISSALLAAGYQQSSTTNYGGNSKVTYKGGNPSMTFDLSSNNGVVTLYGERAN
jgi:hypothetical protein